MADLHRLVAAPLEFISTADAKIRRLAVSACAAGLDEAAIEALQQILRHDPDDRVRAEAAEVLSGAGPVAFSNLMAATDDDAGIVREAIATGFGELEDARSVDWLMSAARQDPEKLVREAAVAALGAIGDARAVPLLLELVASAAPQVRRRSVVALSVFDGPEVEAAITAAKADRNPMVREAAEMVFGH
ncbi:MAG: hypothetical protein HKN91_15925 [Acidimicrobiia bacterium]|nr:hypothetical protein [Acidimicrobiia bacterium]